MSVVSISRVKLFKGCRRAYELKYVHGLIPVETAESLQTGISYHEKLEQLYKDGYFEVTDYSKESAMAMAYKTYIYPKFAVKSAEDWFRYQLPNGDILVGRTDGITPDGQLVEHKTCSGEIGEDYEFDLQWDEQIPAYMLATGARQMWYTVCRKPTIRQKKDESDEEFFKRMVEWYDTDTPKKIRLLRVQRTDAEINAFSLDLRKMIYEINHCENFYRNCYHCTKWGRRCEYSGVCLDYDPNQEYVGYTKKEVAE